MKNITVITVGVFNIKGHLMPAKKKLSDRSIKPLKFTFTSSQMLGFESQTKTLQSLIAHQKLKLEMNSKIGNGSISKKQCLTASLIDQGIQLLFHCMPLIPNHGIGGHRLRVCVPKCYFLGTRFFTKTSGKNSILNV